MSGRNASAITGLFITVFILFFMLMPTVAVAYTVTIAEYTVPTGGSGPYGITSGPDNALWFTENNGNKIGRITTGGVITNEYTVPTAGSQPRGITSGPDNALWFTEYNGNKIGRITTGGSFTEYTVPTGGSGPYGITSGPDGALWFTENSANKIGRVTTGGSFNEYTVPTGGSNPWGITSGPDNALWFTENNGNKIGRVTTGGSFTEYTVPTAPYGITSGPDNALWFTEYNGNKIGRITTGGSFTEYTVPTGGSAPYGITSGPDGALWFTENNGNKIGRAQVTYAVNALVLSGQGTASPPTQNVALGGSATVNIDASTGWLIASLSDNGSPVTVTDPYHMGYQLNNLTADHDVRTIFTAIPPTVTSITPDSGTRGTTVEVTNLAGSNFATTPTVKLKKTGSSDITATNVALVSTAKLTCRIAIPSSAAAGQYSVVVTNPDGQSGTKENAFTVTGAATHPTWYLAEGSTDYGFATYITIENPNSSKVTCKVTYMTKAGAKNIPEVTLPAMSQTVLNPASTLGKTDFSTKVQEKDGKNIAVDRRMTWTGAGAASPESHSSVGVTAPAKKWYLPEGSSDHGFECWTLVQNPNSKDTSVRLTYMIEGKGPVTVPHLVKANSRDSFSMEKDLNGKYDASIKVESDVPVIPERSMYKNNKREGHDSIGTTTPAKDYYLAEGSTDWGFTTYVLIQNPNSSVASVTLTYMTKSGVKTQNIPSMPPNSRKTVNVGKDVPGMEKVDFSTKVHSDKPIIAERAMYWGAGTPLGEACHDSIGMSAPHKTFYLPDGETSSGCETWTLVQNPNSTSVKVEIKYLKPSGKGNVTKTETISKNSRKSFNMAGAGIRGRAAIMVTCKTPGKKIMAERSMYWNNKGAGTDTIGGYGD